MQAFLFLAFCSLINAVTNRNVTSCVRRHTPLPKQTVRPSVWIKGEDKNVRDEHWFRDADIGLVIRGDHGEEAYAVKNWFYNRGQGVVVEIGAHDGLTKSISKSFEESLGWVSYMPELSPSNFKALMQNRPLAHNINVGVCMEEKKLHYLDLDTVGGIIEFMPDDLVKTFFNIKGWLKKDGTKDMETIISSPSVKKINCMPMSLLLQRFQVCHINLFVLDVQGAELQVLRSIDFNAVTVDVWIIEVDKRFESEDEKAIKLLLVGNGYVFHAKIGANIWLHHKGFKGHSIHMNTRLPGAGK